MDVSKLLGEAVESAVFSSGLFTVSRSSSLTVGQTFEIENPNIISAIGVFERYDIYTVDQYYTIDYGTSSPCPLCGRGSS